MFGEFPAAAVVDNAEAGFRQSGKGRNEPKRSRGHFKEPLPLYLCRAQLFAVGVPSSQANAETFEGPSFRKGMWHFVRTLDLVGPRKNKQRLLAREMTRCVDPTHAMKSTFSSSSVGSCVSSKPERSDNKYLFANRCDDMGPVSTVITVHNDASYTELNELTAGKLPRTELIVARRVGDCPDEAPAKSAGLAH